MIRRRSSASLDKSAALDRTWSLLEAMSRTAPLTKEMSLATELETLEIWATR
jgi:hypothetical protein